MNSEATASPPPVEIERATRLGRSIIWRLQRAYFEQSGIDAWRTGAVPHYITSNPFIAAAYARVVVGFLRDLSSTGARAAGEPLTVVELGAGSGRFAYHFLRALLAEPRIPLLKGTPIRYVLTDLSRANLEFCKAHPQLRPYVDAGVLDFAHFDAERDEALRLEISGETIAPGAASRPLVAIANYVFDSLPQDCFRFDGGHLLEARVTVRAPHDAADLRDPATLDRLEVEYEYHPVEGEGESAIDPAFRFLVDHYREVLGEGTCHLPTASLACVRTLSRLASGGLLVLSADRGYCHEEQLLDRDAPLIAQHGSFSYTVDYHALARYIERLGGRALFPKTVPQDLCVGAFLLGAPADPSETLAAFTSAVSDFGPDDWFSVKKGVEHAHEAIDLRHLLAVLRLGAGDAKLFLDVFDRVVDLSTAATVDEQRACFGLARRMWELHYEIREERDLAFHLGVWMRDLGYLVEAVRYFEHALARPDLAAPTAYNLAYCHFGQQRYDEALRWITKALAESPELPGARALRIQISAAMRDAGVAASPQARAAVSSPPHATRGPELLPSDCAAE